MRAPRLVGLIPSLLLSACLAEDIPSSPIPDAGLGAGPDAGLGGGADAGGPGAGPQLDAGTADCRSFAELEALFAARCVGCHGGGRPAAGLDLSPGVAHGALVDVPSRGQAGRRLVVAGDPADSVLVDKLSPSPSVGARMPVGGALSGGELERIASWIAAGAPAGRFGVCSASPDGGPAAGPEPTELRLEAPEGLEVDQGAVLALRVVAVDASGRRLDPVGLTLLSLDEAVAYVDATGQVLGVTPGRARIRALSSGGLAAELELRVRAAVPATVGLGEVAPLLRSRCATAGCHVDGAEPGDLRFDRRPDQLVGKLVLEDAFQAPGAIRVVPGAPNDSYLWLKLARQAPPVGAQMPLGQPPLPAPEAALVLRWILAGAPE